MLAGLGLMGAALLPSVPAGLGVLAWAVAGAGMGLAYAPLSVATLDRAPAGEEGRVTSGLQLCDVLGQAIGTGVAGAIVAATAGGLGHRPGVALAFSFGIVISVTGLIVAARLPDRLIGAEKNGPPEPVPEAAAADAAPAQNPGSVNRLRHRLTRDDVARIG